MRGVAVHKCGRNDVSGVKTPLPELSTSANPTRRIPLGVNAKPARRPGIKEQRAPASIIHSLTPVTWQSSNIQTNTDVIPLAKHLPEVFINPSSYPPTTSSFHQPSTQFHSHTQPNKQTLNSKPKQTIFNHQNGVRQG